MSLKGAKIFRAAMLPVQRLPLGFHYAWGRVFSWFLKNVMHYRSDVVMANLARSFPEMDYCRLKTVYGRFYDHLGEVFAEAMWFGGSEGRPGRLRKQGFCTVEGAEDIAAAFVDSPSVMVLTSHYGNWEVMGGLFEYLGPGADLPDGFDQDAVSVVYKHVQNAFWEYFLLRNRIAPLKDYSGEVESKRILRFALEHRNEKRIYIFPTDQHPYRGAAYSEIPDFMGRRTKVMTGGAALARKLGMSVFSMVLERVEKGKYRMVLKKICDNAAEMEPVEIMERYFAILQESIEAAPEFYLWSHKRWK